MRTYLIRVAVAMLTLVLGLDPLQATVVAQAPGGSAEEQLDDITFDNAGSGPGNVMFARLTVNPGQTVSLPPVTGTSVHFLVYGTWSVQLTEKAATKGAVTPAPLAAQARIDGTPVSPGTEAEVTEGSHLIVPPQTALEIRNTGPEPAVSLAAIVAKDIAVPTKGGVVWLPIGDPVAVPAGPIRIDLTRIVVQPGAGTDPETTDKVEVLDIVAGPVVLVINPGHVRITRANGAQETIRASWEDPAATPDAAAAEEANEEGGPGLIAPPPGTPIPGTAIGLNEGDAAVLAAGGTRVLRASGNAPAVVVVMGICVPKGGSGTCGGT